MACRWILDARSNNVASHLCEPFSSLSSLHVTNVTLSGFGVASGLHLCIQYGVLVPGMLLHDTLLKPGHTSCPGGGQSTVMRSHSILKQSFPVSGKAHSTLASQ